VTGVGQGVLFPVEAGDEASTADLAARLHLAAGAHDVAPQHGQTLAGDRLPEHDPGAPQELASHELRGVSFAARLDAQDAPATGAEVRGAPP
jgi:hypothetical protein